LRCFVGAQPLLNLGDGQSLAGRAALMKAEIAELFGVTKDANFLVADKDDPPVAFVEVRNFSHEFLGHAHNLSGRPSRHESILNHEAKRYARAP